jgi:ribosome-associated translation inhibitor RaiA
MRAPGFPVEIRSADFALTPSMKLHTLMHFTRKLDKHGRRILGVVVRFEDKNGARGGVDKVCRVEVLMPRQPPLVVEEVDTDLYAAVDVAAERIDHAVGRELERARARPRARGRTLKALRS